jgi:hypothetical protein
MKFLNLEPQRAVNFLLATSVAILFFLSSFEPTSAIGSDTPGSIVDGTFQIDLDEGPTRHIEFHATRSSDGTVSGETIFRDDPVSSSQKQNDGAPDSSQPFFFKADFDCLVINKNKAIMSGAITDSSSPRYVGRRVLVIAQDNGGATDSSKTDRLTWGVYHSDKKWWVPSDSERPAGEISQQSWIATDSERPDDEGILSDKEQVVGCQSFPLSSFSFFNVKQGHGSVRVRP